MITTKEFGDKLDVVATKEKHLETDVLYK